MSKPYKLAKMGKDGNGPWASFLSNAEFKNSALELYGISPLIKGLHITGGHFNPCISPWVCEAFETCPKVGMVITMPPGDVPSNMVVNVPVFMSWGSGFSAVPITTTPHVSLLVEVADSLFSAHLLVVGDELVKRACSPGFLIDRMVSMFMVEGSTQFDTHTDFVANTQEVCISNLRGLVKALKFSLTSESIYAVLGTSMMAISQPKGMQFLAPVAALLLGYVNAMALMLEFDGDLLTGYKALYDHFLP